MDSVRSITSICIVWRMVNSSLSIMFLDWSKYIPNCGGQQLLSILYIILHLFVTTHGHYDYYYVPQIDNDPVAC